MQWVDVCLCVSVLILALPPFLIYFNVPLCPGAVSANHTWGCVPEQCPSPSQCLDVSMTEANRNRTAPVLFLGGAVSFDSLGGSLLLQVQLLGLQGWSVVRQRLSETYNWSVVWFFVTGTVVLGFGVGHWLLALLMHAFSSQARKHTVQILSVGAKTHLPLPSAATVPTEGQNHHQPPIAINAGQSSPLTRQESSLSSSWVVLESMQSFGGSRGTRRFSFPQLPSTKVLAPGQEHTDVQDHTSLSGASHSPLLFGALPPAGQGERSEEGSDADNEADTDTQYESPAEDTPVPAIMHHQLTPRRSQRRFSLLGTSSGEAGVPSPPTVGDGTLSRNSSFLGRRQSTPAVLCMPSHPLLQRSSSPSPLMGRGSSSSGMGLAHSSPSPASSFISDLENRPRPSPLREQLQRRDSLQRLHAGVLPSCTFYCVVSCFVGVWIFVRACWCVCMNACMYVYS